MTRVAYPARAHAARTVQQFFARQPSATPKHKRIFYLEGEITRERHDTDRELPFHQESTFFYLSGFDSPGGRLLIEADGPENFTTHLFIADVDPEGVMWSGYPPLVEDVRKTHDVDQVSVVSQLESHLSSIAGSSSTIHTLPWTPSPSPKAKHDSTSLIEACHFARFKKDEEEVALIRQACDLSSRAHEVLMRNISRGEHLSTEAEAEALFVQQCRRAGCVDSLPMN